MSYQFICYPKCSTCQRARRWLEEHNIPFSERDIKASNPTAQELAGWCRESGLLLRRFFNTSGQMYKSLSLKDKVPNMSEEEQLSLLATDGMLVRRPVLAGDGVVLVGFREDDWRSALLQKR